MKRSFALCLVFILSLSAVVLAGEGSLVGSATVTEGMEVTAYVGPYASIQFASESMQLPDFLGRAGERKSVTSTFTISTNTNVSLSWMLVEPLTEDGGTNTIATQFVLIDQLKKQADGRTNHELPWGIEYRPDTAYWLANNGNFNRETNNFHYGRQEITYLNLQAQGIKTYDIRVTGTLGAIHDQAAGNYTADILLTLSEYR